MNNGKSYNSLLFLTTLSIYLGLVLVGASPSVLAQQAALTQKFEVQNEIEVEDDLDNKPGDESLEDFLLVRLDAALNQFVESLRDLKFTGKYKNDASFSTGFYYIYCSENLSDAGSGIVLEKGDVFSDSVMNLRKTLDIGNGGRNLNNLPDFLEPTQADNNFCKSFSAGFKADKSNLEINLMFSKNPQNALISAENLNSLFFIKAVNAQNQVTQQFYENTKAKAENQYVVVSTRLARGSLDSLVKDKR